MCAMGDNCQFAHGEGDLRGHNGKEFRELIVDPIRKDVTQANQQKVVSAANYKSITLYTRYKPIYILYTVYSIL